MSKQQGFVEVGNTKLYYEREGTGPDLVMLHAGIADHRMWDTQVQHFADRYRILRYDLRGFGQSMNPAGSYFPHENLNALLDHCELKQAILIGCSYGGRVAIDFALTYPHRVKALILIAASVGGFAHGEEIQTGWQAEEDTYKQGGIYPTIEQNLRMWVDGPQRLPHQVDMFMRERVREMLIRTYQIPQEQDEGEGQPLDPSALSRLVKLTMPILSVVGSLDFVDVQTVASQIASTVTNGQLITIPNVAHLPNMEKPDVVNHILQDFLNSINS